MSEAESSTHEDDERDRTDASELSEDGVGGTMTDEPNTMEPEEGLTGEE